MAASNSTDPISNLTKPTKVEHLATEKPSNVDINLVVHDCTGLSECIICEMKKDHSDNACLVKYVSKESLNSCIIRTRESFEARSLHLNGPAMIPTVFRDHPVVRPSVSVKNPPPQIPMVFNFPETIFRNIVINFKNGIFIKPNLTCKSVCMRRQISPEKALEEIVKRTPCYYSPTWEQKTSPFSDPDSKNRAVPLPKNCLNEYRFTADFSIIYPEGKESSVFIFCPECGQFVETMLSGNSLSVFKEDIWKHVCLMNFSREDGKPKQSTLKMPPRSGLDENLAFTEVHVAVAPLSSADPLRPSVYVRTRIMMTTSIGALFKKYIHQARSESGVFPSHNDTMMKFGII